MFVIEYSIGISPLFNCKNLICLALSCFVSQDNRIAQISLRFVVVCVFCTVPVSSSKILCARPFLHNCLFKILLPKKAKFLRENKNTHGLKFTLFICWDFINCAK